MKRYIKSYTDVKVNDYPDTFFKNMEYNRVGEAWLPWSSWGNYEKLVARISRVNSDDRPIFISDDEGATWKEYSLQELQSDLRSKEDSDGKRYSLSTRDYTNIRICDTHSDGIFVIRGKIDSCSMYN